MSLETYLLTRRPFCAKCFDLTPATQVVSGETWCDHHATREREEIAFRARQSLTLDQTESAAQWFDDQQGKVWDEKREHERDLEHESRVDYESNYTEQGE